MKVIFGKKAEDVMDASLCVPPGVTGKILATKVFVRKEKMAKKDENKRMKEIDLELESKIESIRADRKSQSADDVAERQTQGNFPRVTPWNKKRCSKVWPVAID